ncbi:MAG: cytochrome c oxidase subunit II [Planctomycetes bacterium]|nr:cytochrome c oxidase subunit II [Planctomycetota bacterium]
MSIFAVPAGWLKAPHGAERTWLAIALLWCLVLSVMMPYWHLKGKQTSSGEAYDVEPGEFNARVEKFVRDGKVDVRNGIPVVEAPPGGHAYLIGRSWTWYPILKLKKGVEYKLHVSSLDFQHGFSLQGKAGQGLNMNFSVLPGYDHVLTITPTSAGEFNIICNEFCGMGHEKMTGLIVVEE